MPDPSGFPQSEPPNSSLPKIRSIFDFTAEALEEFAVWLEQRGLTTPVSQIIGFSQFQVQDGGVVTTTEARTSATYGDLATVGPQLTALPDGKYAFYFGCSAFNGAGTGDARMAVSVNSGVPVDANGVVWSGGNTSTSLSRVVVASLAAGTNTAKAQYRGDGANASSFFNRWLIALRISNS